MSGARIRVDFNSRIHDGLVRSSLRRADRPVRVGDRVIAYQPGENMEHFARVVTMEPDSGRIELDVDWSSRPAESVVKLAGGSSIAFLFAETKPYSVSRVASGAATTAAPSHAFELQPA